MPLETGEVDEMSYFFVLFVYNNILRDRTLSHSQDAASLYYFSQRGVATTAAFKMFVVRDSHYLPRHLPLMESPIELA